MLNITITEQTTHNMLRAIRAACNELLGETHADLTTQAAQHNSRANELHAAASGAATAAVLSGLASTALAPIPAIPETDSTGAEWNPELHASTKAKNQDGTWKKRRGATVMTADGKPSPEQVEKVIERFEASQAAANPVPPLPPAAPAAEPIMPKIFALITSQIVTINQAVEAAQAEGFADLGANGLGGAPVEKQLAVLRKLEG